jgi:hypothetical protein
MPSIVTAVEGGHIDNLDDSNATIREIVEQRNRSREPNRVVDSKPASVDNPKDIEGCKKPPMGLFPPTAIAIASLSLMNGAEKYGRANWRAIPVRATIYLDAIRRHLSAFEDGEDFDGEGMDHLGAALASLAIILDAREVGTLIDDRSAPGGFRQVVERLQGEPERIRRMHADKSPKDFLLREDV